MTADDWVRLGFVGKPHGLDGFFRLERATERWELLAPGSELRLESVGAVKVNGRKGTAARPIVRLKEVKKPGEQRGKALLVERSRLRLGAGEWLGDELVGCEVVGVGEVTGVWYGPTVDALEIDGGTLMVPLIGDAVRSIDVAGRTIEVDRAFLGLGEQP
ncbi:MAG: hypothetical protein ACR2NA_02620 [Solirubrobacterales bacterium]